MPPSPSERGYKNKITKTTAPKAIYASSLPRIQLKKEKSKTNS